MTKSALIIENLRVAYGEKVAVDDVSVELARGELVGYLGPNGAGKSTTLKAIAGMVIPQDGAIAVGGVSAVTDPQKVKQMIGFLHESGAIYDVLTPREHFALIADLRQLDRAKLLGKGEEVLDFLELDSDVRDKRMHDFSKGMKQKVAIASALLHEPELLLLDEPLNGLDVNATSRFKQLLVEYAEKGGTVLYSSHLLDVVERLCQRVIILHEGKVLERLSLENMKETHPGKTLEDLFHELTGFEPAHFGGQA